MSRFLESEYWGAIGALVAVGIGYGMTYVAEALFAMPL
jgi:hypothetical protein